MLIAKNNPVIEEVRAGGKAEGLVEGRAEGLAEGRATGLAEGRAALAAAVVAVLALRRVVLDSADRDRILRERDPARLERWIVRAATCTTTTELLAEP